MSRNGSTGQTASALTLEKSSLLWMVRLTQGDMADLVGANCKRVSQVMVSLKDQRLIELDARTRITLTSRQGLAKYCM